MRTRLNRSIQDTFGYFMLEVEDNGVGILPSEVNSLFTPFFKTKDKESRSMNTKGHGLGLYISRKIARFLGGDLTVQSVYQSGSKFCMNLPVELV